MSENVRIAKANYQLAREKPREHNLKYQSKCKLLQFVSIF